MPNFIIKIVMATLFFNIACGIVASALPFFGTDPAFMGGIVTDEQKTRDSLDKMNQSIDSKSVLDTSQSTGFNRVIDLLNIGMLDKFLKFLTSVMYGIVTILERTIGGMMLPTLRTSLFSLPFGYLAMILNIGYSYCAWTLWTGRYTGDQ
jgi:hypothetical protein